MSKSSLKKRFSSQSSILIIALMTLMGVVLVWRIFAAVAQGQIYTPNGTQTVKPGDSFSVEVKLNTNGEPISFVQAALSYPADKMTLTGVDYSNSAFPLEIKSSISSGNINLARGPSLGTSPVSGDVTIAKLNFTATANASGSGTVNLDYANSMTLSNNSNTNTLPSQNGSLTLSTITFSQNPGPGNATLSLDPSTQTVSAGEDVALNLQLDTGGDPVNVAQVYINYPKDKLQYVSTQPGTVFDTEVVPTVDNNGTVELARYTSPQAPPANGANLSVATIHFKALNVTATADVTIGTNSIIARATDNKNVLKNINNAAIGINSTPPPPDKKAVLYLTPASQSVKEGNAFSLQLRVNTNGDPVNVVQTTISYPSEDVSFVASDSSSDFPITGPESGGPGVFEIVRFISGGANPVNGDALVATLHFNAKSVNATAAINISSDSIVARSTDNQNTLSQVVGAAVGISTNGHSTPPPPPAPKPSSPTKPRPSATSANPTPTTSVISDSIASSNVGSTSTSQTTLSGVTVNLTVTQPNGTAVSNKRFDLAAGATIYSAITDAQGKAVYRNVKAGDYTIKSSDYNQLKPTKITVSSDTSKTIQNFTVTATSSASSLAKWLVILLLILLIGGGLGALWWVLFRDKPDKHAGPTALEKAASTIVPTSSSKKTSPDSSQVFYPKQKDK